MAPSPEFELATLQIEKVNGVVADDDLLKLYGLFKVAHGTKIGEAPSPGMFDFVGKAKKAAWQKEADKKMTEQQAQAEYIKLVEEQKAKLGYDASRKVKANNKAINEENLKRFDELSK